MQYVGFERIDAKTNKILSREMRYSNKKIIDMNKSPEEIISINTALWNKIYKASILKKIKERYIIKAKKEGKNIRRYDVFSTSIFKDRKNIICI